MYPLSPAKSLPGQTCNSLSPANVITRTNMYPSVTRKGHYWEKHARLLEKIIFLPLTHTHTHTHARRHAGTHARTHTRTHTHTHINYYFLLINSEGRIVFCCCFLSIFCWLNNFKINLKSQVGKDSIKAERKGKNGRKEATPRTKRTTQQTKISYAELPARVDPEALSPDYTPTIKQGISCDIALDWHQKWSRPRFLRSLYPSSGREGNSIFLCFVLFGKRLLPH